MTEAAEKTEAELAEGQQGAEEPPPVEARARRMGWRPREEYRGDPERWVTAEEYIEKGENELPILRERLRTGDRRLDQAERALTGVQNELKETKAVLTEFRDFASRGEKRAYERAVTDLEERHRKQVSEADVPGAEATMREIKQLEQEKPSEKPKVTIAEAEKPAVQVIDPAVHAWVKANEDWYTTDPMMRGAAIALHGQLMQERPDLSIPENLAEVKRRIVRRFPDAFENPRRNGAGAVAGSQEPGSGKRGSKTYADLPPEAKRACDRFIAQIPPDPKTKKPYSREEYVQMYFAGEQ